VKPPKATLIEVGPDLVGLAEAAELIGLSRHRCSIFLWLPTARKVVNDALLLKS